MTKRRELVGLVVSFIAAYSTAAVGAAASVRAQPFYEGLNRPAWAPPGWVFGPVWTVLYGLMAVAAWLVWRRGEQADVRGALRLYGAQLVANALWSWLFFAWREGAWATVEIVILWGLILATLVAFARVQWLAGWLLAPYLAWVTFATALCYSTWRMNPQAL